jgi:23S rRNA pseudouridine2457 synthase
MEKTYWAQVEHIISDEALKMLAAGIELKDGKTRPAKARRVEQPVSIWPRVPPIRERKNIATSWLELTIKEGRNRQVRRMTAAVGFPTLRLIRYRVGSWTIDGIDNGQYVILKNRD